MKRLLILLFFVVGLSANGQELSVNAQAFRNSKPDAYNCIRQNAIEQWDNDHVMILYTINNQVDAWIDFWDLITKEYNNDKEALKMMLEIIEDWGGEAEDDYCRADWVMVLYTFKNQIEARSKY